MKSIQQRLLTSLLIGLPLLWLLTSSFIAWRLWHEINEMNDTQITQVARYLIGISADEDNDKHDYDYDDKQGKNKESYSAKIYNLKSRQLSGDLGNAKDDYMGFAIWDKKGCLLMADENGQSFDFLPDQHGFLEEHDFAYQRLNPFSKRWCLFYIHDEHSHKHERRVIAVGQNLVSRQEMIVDAMSVQVLPMLIGLFVFMGLVIWLIRRGFMPLSQISAELEQRQPHDDSPITADVPKEPE